MPPLLWLGNFFFKTFFWKENVLWVLSTLQPPFFFFWNLKMFLFIYSLIISYSLFWPYPIHAWSVQILSNNHNSCSFSLLKQQLKRNKQKPQTLICGSQLPTLEHGSCPGVWWIHSVLTYWRNRFLPLWAVLQMSA